MYNLIWFSLQILLICGTESSDIMKLYIEHNCRFIIDKLTKIPNIFIRFVSRALHSSLSISQKLCVNQLEYDEMEMILGYLQYWPTRDESELPQNGMKGIVFFLALKCFLKEQSNCNYLLCFKDIIFQLLKNCLGSAKLSKEKQLIDLIIQVLMQYRCHQHDGGLLSAEEQYKFIPSGMTTEYLIMS